MYGTNVFSETKISTKGIALFLFCLYFSQLNLLCNLICLQFASFNNINLFRKRILTEIDLICPGEIQIRGFISRFTTMLDDM